MARSTAHRPSAANKVVDLRRPPDTRERVLQVSQQLFAERGYRGTSLRDIAKRIGIKAPSLLHHFPSKQQLYVAVLDRMFESIENAAAALEWGQGDRQERMRQAVCNAIDFMIAKPNFVRLLWMELAEESGMGRQIVKRRIPPLFSLAVNFIYAGQREGQFRADVDPNHFMWSLDSLTLGFLATAAVNKKMFGLDLLSPEGVELRKREVLKVVERTLFVPSLTPTNSPAGAGAKS
jgi:AcrR family transcriptional regulator